MKRADIIAAFRKGCESSTTENITVNREQLLIAIGAKDEPKEEAPSVVVEPTN